MPLALWCSIAMLGLLHFLGLKFRGAMPSYFTQDFDLSDKTSTVTLVKIFLPHDGYLYHYTGAIHSGIELPLFL